MTGAVDPVALAQALIRCPSVTPEEAGALDLVAALLKPAGFTVDRMTFSEPGTPDVENLYARIGRSGLNLCFAGHVDVVAPGDTAAWTSPPFEGAVRDGLLIGRGACDMKGAVACFLAAALDRVGAGRHTRGSISLLLTCDEEGPSINGTAKVLDWLSARGERLDACLVGEPSNPERLGDEIKIGRRGSLTAELVVQGRQGHVAYPQLADNPIPKLARMLARLADVHLDDGTPDFQPSTLAMSVLSVPNAASNVIPAHARAIFNVRYNTCHTRASLEALIGRVVGEAAAEAEARFDLTFSGTGDVFLTRPGPLVATLVRAVETVVDRTPALTTAGGTSDARFIQAFCPVVEFGLVNRTIHQVDEHVAVADLLMLTDVYREFLDQFFSDAATA